MTAATLNALHELAIASGTRGVRAVARLAADHARALLDVGAAAIYTYDEERRLLLPVGETESPLPEAPVVPGEGAIGLAFESALPVVVDDYQHWERAVATSAAKGMVSAIAVPLIAGERPVGALGVWTYERRPFRAEEEQLLTLFAAQVAPALEAARLNQQREAAARIFEALHELAVATGGMHDPAQIASLCVDRANRILNADGASLAWWDEEAQVLRPLAENGAAASTDRILRSGEGAAGAAFKWREAVAVNDYPSWAQSSAEGRRRGLKSVLAVPLVVRDRAVGTLTVRSLTSREFSSAEMELMRLFAAQIAPSLQAVRLLETSAAQVRELRTLHDIAVAAGGVLEPRRLAALVVAEAASLLQADRAVLRTWDANAERLTALADSAGGEVPPVRIGQGLPGLVFEAGRPMTVDDMTAWDAGDEWARQHGFASAVMVPLVSNQKPTGVLGAFTTHSRKFTERDIRLLSLLAGQVAPAMEAAQLADSLQERARVFAALHEVAVAAGGVLDPHELAQLMSERARDLLQVDRVMVITHDAESGTLRTLADSIGTADEWPPPVSPGRGLAGLAFERAETVRVDDYPNWPAGLEWGRRRRFRSALAMPLVAGDRVVGVITAVALRARRFSDEDERLLSLMVSQLAPALAGAAVHAELAASERALRGIYDTASVAIVRNDLDGRVVWMNRAGCELFGYQEWELRGLDRGALMAPEAQGLDDEPNAELTSGRLDRYRVQRRCIKKDGTRFWGDVTIGLVRHGDGRPDFYYAMVEDITERKAGEQALQESEERKSAILAAALDCVIAVDEQARVVEVNPAAERTFGVAREAAVGRPLADFLVLPAEWRALAGRRVELDAHRAGGESFPAEVSVGALVEGERRVRSLAVRDLSERRAAEAARREMEDRFRAVFDRAAIGIASLDLEGRVLECNPALERLLGLAGGSLGGRPFSDLIHLDDRADLHLSRLAAGEASEHQVELRYLTGGGGDMWGNTIASTVRSAGGAPRFLIVMVEDITLRKAHEAALEHRAMHDPLTDLPNRALLDDRLKQAILSARRDRDVGAVLVMDMDGFKQVNDAHGHHCGDELLRQIGERMRAGLRGSDTVARLGGDEFAVVLPGIGSAEGAAIAVTKLGQAMAEPFVVDGHTVRVSASIGSALFPVDGEDSDELMRLADSDMYDRKRAR